MAVRNLPIFPEHVFPINTPRPERESAKPQAFVPPAPVGPQIEKWWTETGVAHVESITDVLASEINHLAKSAVHRHAHEKDVLTLNECLVRREAEIRKLQAEVATLSENVALFYRGLVDLRETITKPQPTLPVTVKFTPMEWVMMILSLGVWKPTKRQP
jgi:hypothetical protein